MHSKSKHSQMVGALNAPTVRWAVMKSGSLTHFTRGSWWWWWRWWSHDNIKSVDTMLKCLKFGDCTTTCGWCKAAPPQLEAGDMVIMVVLWWSMVMMMIVVMMSVMVMMMIICRLNRTSATDSRGPHRSSEDSLINTFSWPWKENQDPSLLKICLKYKNMQWKVCYVQKLYSIYILKGVLGVLDQTGRL